MTSFSFYAKNTFHFMERSDNTMFIFGKNKQLNKLYESINVKLKEAEDTLMYYKNRLSQAMSKDERAICIERFNYWLGEITALLVVKNELDNMLHNV